eukprot:TRINITY_DN1539_c0_g1_i1.p1 TRINITY_DN1539_c0_g1~~TRINITY_DN1539_c0_g1_i1.p1  ORF type:complete len:314 (+),score=89.76 TRINITY_DN1539_c0_g1_i1:149-1090(+)
MTLNNVASLPGGVDVVVAEETKIEPGAPHVERQVSDAATVAAGEGRRSREPSHLVEFVKHAADPEALRQLNDVPMPLSGAVVTTAPPSMGPSFASTRLGSRRFGSARLASLRVDKAKRREAHWEQRLDRYDGVPGPGHQHASLVSRLFFWWINPLIALAGHQPLRLSNLWAPPAAGGADALTARFDASWRKERERPKGQSSLARALMRMFRMQLLVTGIMALVQQAATLVIPLLVQQLLQWYQDPSQPVGRGYMLAAILFCVGCVGNGIIANHLYMKLYNMGMDARTTVNALIYRKVRAYASSVLAHAPTAGR